MLTNYVIEIQNVHQNTYVCRSSEQGHTDHEFSHRTPLDTDQN